MNKHDAEIRRLSETIDSYRQAVQQKGVVEGFRQFLAEEATMLTTGHSPISGRDAICEYLATLPITKLTWKPFYIDMAASCDLAYSLGSFQLHLRNDSGGIDIVPGNYITVWRKQSNGNWLCVFDAGQSGPPPA